MQGHREDLDGVAVVVVPRAAQGHRQARTQLGLVRAESLLPECLRQLPVFLVRIADHQVKVVVPAGLPSDQGVDAPPTRDPAFHPRGGEQIQHAEHP